MLRDDLRAGLRDAMRSRDRTATSAIRSALAAIDNAEAIPLDPDDPRHRAGAVEASAVGVGAAEAERRDLTESDVAAIVRREIEEREQVMREVADHAPEQAAALAAEANHLRAFVD